MPEEVIKFPFKGYNAAATVDKLINRILETEGGITPENAMEFVKFARTIQTSAMCCLYEAYKQLGIKHSPTEE